MKKALGSFFMTKKLFLSLFILLLVFIFTPAIYANDKIAGSSAVFSTFEKKDTRHESYIIRKEAIRQVLKQQNSPLTDSVDSFIEACKTYEIDCYLLPAISGLESSYGVHVMPGSHNPFGWGGGTISFIDWDQAINTVGKGLRNNYIDKGADSIDKIGSTYAASPTWAVRVRMFMQKFRNEEANLPLYLTDNSI